MSKRMRQDLPDYNRAMAEAHLADRQLVDEDHDQPYCLERPDLYVDYDQPHPTRERAQEMCAPCPLIEMCLKNARHMKPGWGVWGGVAWVAGRQVHLLPEDDERLSANSQVI